MVGQVAQSCWLLLTLSLKGKIIFKSTCSIHDGIHLYCEDQVTHHLSIVSTLMDKNKVLSLTVYS